MTPCSGWSMRSSGRRPRAAKLQALASTKDLQVLTGKLTIDPKTHNPLNKPAVIQQVDKDGKFTLRQDLRDHGLSDLVQDCSGLFLHAVCTEHGSHYPGRQS